MLRPPFHLLRKPCLALTPDSMQLSRADHQGSTPLHWAAWEGSEIVVKYACDTNHHFLAIAAVFPSREGEMDRYLARLFLTKHQPRADLNRRNKFGYTALLYASCVHRSCLACTRPRIRIPLALRRSLACLLASLARVHRSFAPVSFAQVRHGAQHCRKHALVRRRRPGNTQRRRYD